MSFGQPFSAKAWSLTECARELQRIGDAVAGGDIADCERLLAAQASALNWVFASFAHRAALGAENNALADAETFLRLALRAQGQCRATVEALASMKRPRQLAFVAQTNVQVNNGRGDAPVSQGENLPTELLESDHEQRLDPGAPSTPSRQNSRLAAVAALHGAALGRGQGQVGNEPLPRREEAYPAACSAAGPRAVQAGRRRGRAG